MRPSNKWIVASCGCMLPACSAAARAASMSLACRARSAFATSSGSSAAPLGRPRFAVPGSMRTMTPARSRPAGPLERPPLGRLPVLVAAPSLEWRRERRHDAHVRNPALDARPLVDAARALHQERFDGYADRHLGGGLA